MSLPLLQTVNECASFSKTVEPFLPQLYALPHQTLQVLASPQSFKDLYLSTNPLITAFAFSLLLAPIFLVISEINKNYSQVDRCWSILPTVYNAHYVFYAHAQNLPTRRLDALLAFSTIWSIRLTANYWRKGGYSIGSEDYRWEVLKSYIGPALFVPFNIVFISLYQSILLFSITMPTYILLLVSKSARHNSLPLDIWISVALVSMVLLAALADQQQWNFQNAKRDYKNSAKVPARYTHADLERGFLTKGLFAYSRHPNFAAEQSVWVGLYLWSCYVTETYYNWSGVGAISYLILFQGSTWFTELLSSRKYPEYVEYRKRVGMFLPGLFSLFSGGFQDNTPADHESKKLK